MGFRLLGKVGVVDDIFYPLLEEVLSLPPPRPGFYSVSLYFALGWAG